MKFFIEKIIIWPKKKNKNLRILELKEKSTNIIYGLSRTGKSAIIPVIDYCLGSELCRIPVNIIRDASEWFGLLINIDDKQLLLCRHEPGSLNKNLNKMFIKIDNKIDLPRNIESNITLDGVKGKLNELLGFTTNGVSAEDNSFDQRPSYRDAVSLLFQPQNIIANGNTLFYKVDMNIYKTRLIRLFPYFLRYENDEVIKLNYELSDCKKNLTRLMREENSLKEVSDKWAAEIDYYIESAYQYGLINKMPDLNVYSFQEKVTLLNNVLITKPKIELNDANIDGNSTNIAYYEGKVKDLSSKLSQYCNHLSLIKQIKQDYNIYGEAKELEKSRLSISKWLFQRVDENIDKYGFTREQLLKIIDSCNEVEQEDVSIKNKPQFFDKEIRELQNNISAITSELNKNRSILEQMTKNNGYGIEDIYKFYGRLERTIDIFNSIDQTTEVKNKINELKNQITSITNRLNEIELLKNKKEVLKEISTYISDYISTLDAEDKTAIAELDIEELTIKIKNNYGKYDYLWDLGSGSNWLSYHIATLLSLHEYFQKQDDNVVPGIIVFDQPSQVYFPNDKSLDEFNDEDVKAVGMVFNTIDSFVKKNNVQVLVLEHAGENIWGSCESKHIVANWREGDKLIPLDWI